MPTRRPVLIIMLTGIRPDRRRRFAALVALFFAVLALAAAAPHHHAAPVPGAAAAAAVVAAPFSGAAAAGPRGDWLTRPSLPAPRVSSAIVPARCARAARAALPAARCARPAPRLVPAPRPSSFPRRRPRRPFFLTPAFSIACVKPAGLLGRPEAHASGSFGRSLRAGTHCRAGRPRTRGETRQELNKPVIPLSRSFLAVTAVLLLGGLTLLPCRAQEGAPPPPPPEEVGPPPAPAPPAPPDAPPVPAEPGPAGGGRSLLLPDISLVSNLLGHLSSDERDQERDRLRLDEAELGIQSYVYPGIRADAFFVFGDGEAVVEEGFLTVENVGLGGLPLAATVGRRKVPFGRVNQLHPHSWLYTVQPYALSNLVSGESLTGDGGYLSYLLPTPFFAQVEAGFWSLSESPEDFDAQVDPSADIVTSPGAGFADRFLTLRLWTAAPALGGDVELGGSLARGRGVEYGSDSAGPTVRPTIQLSALDLTYRRGGRGASRFLLRSEYVRHRQEDGDFRRTSDGYYVLADQRFGRYTSLAARYDWSEFPFAPDLHESAVSLIGTRQLTEQTYLRLQLIRGDRPGKEGFNEVWFQWVWGVGPHTHNLE